MINSKNPLLQQRQQAALQSQGESLDIIRHSIIQIILQLDQPPQKVLDVGCGTGKLLQMLQETFPTAQLSGCDIHNFLPAHLQKIAFFQQDLNLDFSSRNHFDLIISSEVIEHLENPRHFLRNLATITNEKGHIILTTPNIESITSLISFTFRGYFSAFGPRNYPAHITPLCAFALQNIIQEVENLTLQQIYYIPHGRIPATNKTWQQFLPFLRGKRFSDNYLVVIQKG